MYKRWIEREEIATAPLTHASAGASQ
jgi:hypothetical protein